MIRSVDVCYAVMCLHINVTKVLEAWLALTWVKDQEQLGPGNNYTSNNYQSFSGTERIASQVTSTLKVIPLSINEYLTGILALLVS